MQHPPSASHSRDLSQCCPNTNSTKCTMLPSETQAFRHSLSHSVTEPHNSRPLVLCVLMPRNSAWTALPLRRDTKQTSDPMHSPYKQTCTALKAAASHTIPAVHVA
jgi:hypothetical protein